MGVRASRRRARRPTRRGALGALVLGATLLAVGAGCRALAESVAAPAIAPSVAAQVQRGSARVIVRLRVAGGVRPEGELAAPVAAAQRAAIATAQQAVLSRLAGTAFTLVRSYSTTPFLALEVGPGALAALERMGDVVLAVTLDELAAPSGGAAAPAGPPGRPR